jgi:hypothetical protein
VSDTRSVHRSKQELSRTQVLRELDEGRIKQRHAAEQLKRSVRQVKRLLKTDRHLGDEGLLSKKHTLELLLTRYADLGPTFAHEKLTEGHPLALGRETVRGLMIHAGL